MEEGVASLPPTASSASSAASAAATSSALVNAAIASGATYMVFWKADPATGQFRVAASYERALSSYDDEAAQAARELTVVRRDGRRHGDVVARHRSRMCSSR